MLEAEQGELGVPGGRAVRGSVGVPLDSRIFKIQYGPQVLPGVSFSFPGTEDACTPEGIEKESVTVFRGNCYMETLTLRV